MRSCADVRERLMAGETADLRGEGDPALAAHLRGCAACANAAGLILAAEAELDRALGRRPALDAAAVVARALAVEPRSSTRSPVRWMALAAAAAVALLMVSRRDPSLPGRPVTASVAGPAVVEAPVGHNVAVIPTRDPDITVVWFF